MRSKASKRRAGIAVAIAAALLVFAASPSPAAASPAFLFDFGFGSSSLSHSANAAGELNIPRGVATDATTGHVYVGDQSNKRIDEFTAWGQFVKAWGWGVRDGSAELQACTSETGCQGGISGAGAGQFASSQGVAVDSSGDVYVVDRPNRRVQKFDSEGDFLRMWGKGVDQGGGSPEHPGDLCTAEYLADGDTCGAGSIGEGEGQFGAWTVLGSYIAVGPGDAIWVGDVGRIQRFNAAGAYQGEIALDESEEKVKSLAVDSAGNVYAAIENEGNVQDGVRKWSSSGTLLASVEVEEPVAIATGPEDELYVVSDASGPGEGPRIVGFDSGGAEIFENVDNLGEEQLGTSTGIGTNPAGTIYTSSYFNTVPIPPATGETHSYLRAFGPEPRAYGDPPKEPPRIVSQHAATVGTTSATLAARIDPEFWRTDYYVEYGTSPCSEGGCATEPAPPGIPMGGTLALVGNASVPLEGLEAGRRYYFRFVAESEGGGPVYGEDESFLTYRPPEVDASCANAASRGGASAHLPDCRAYEMVSPPDKNGGDVDALRFEGFDETGYLGFDQSAADGGKIAYSATSAFGGAEGSPLISQYIGKREAGGWATEPISPPQRGGTASFVGVLGSEYKAFSPDLSSGWLKPESGVVLAPCAGDPEADPEGYSHLYRRDMAGGAYASLCSAGAEPDTCPPEGECPYPWLYPELEGYSSDGSRAVYRVNDALTSEAPRGLPKTGDSTGGQWQLYEWVAGKGPHLVSVLPDGRPYEGSSSAGQESRLGVAFSAKENNLDTVAGAVSADGSLVYWSTAVDRPHGPTPGQLYLRVNADREPREASHGTGTVSEGSPTVSGVSTADGEFAAGQRIFGEGIPDGATIAAAGSETLTLSAAATLDKEAVTLTAKGPESECTGPQTPCTLAVSPAGSARFWAASPDGTRAIYSGTGGFVAGRLLEYAYNPETETGKTTQIATETLGVAGTSSDLTYVYFASKAVLATGAAEGQPNLYYEHEGAIHLVATLSAEDVLEEEGFHVFPSPVSPEPAFRAARVTPDGRHIVFLSASGALARESAGYDNADAASGEPDREVYLYEAGGKVVCASCDPSGAAPVGRDYGERGRAAAWIPGQQTPLYERRPLSRDGRRLFFNSLGPLALQDTNGVQDVYQWEAPGKGRCTAASPTYSSQDDGCVDLISSGQGSREAEFVDASASGDDVFFRTQSQLVPADSDRLVDLYDARVLGGFAQPSSSSACEGEACQSPPPAPAAPTPASAAFAGPGNQLQAAPGRKRCPKGKRRVRRRGKVRCVRRRKRAKRRHHRHHRRGVHRRSHGVPR